MGLNLSAAGMGLMQLLLQQKPSVLCQHGFKPELPASKDSMQLMLAQASIQMLGWRTASSPELCQHSSCCQQKPRCQHWPHLSSVCINAVQLFIQFLAQAPTELCYVRPQYSCCQQRNPDTFQQEASTVTSSCESVGLRAWLLLLYQCKMSASHTMLIPAKPYPARVVVAYVPASKMDDASNARTNAARRKLLLAVVCQ